MKEKGIATAVMAAVIVIIVAVAGIGAYFMLKGPEGGGPGGEEEEEEGPVRIHDQNISGEIKQDQIWSGTIHVTGDVLMPEGVTLTIEPGTIIKMAANSDDQHSGEEHVKDELTWDRENGVWKDLSATKEYTQSHINFDVEGTLIAIGTPDKQIIFTSDSSSPYYLDWDHMTIKNGTVKYCVFEWAHAGPNIANGVFSNNIVRHMFWGGIHAYDGSPLIENNLVEDIGHEGIDTLRSSAIIRNNIIRKTRTSGIVTRYAGYDGKPTVIEGNLIVNAGPIHLQMYSSAIVRNNILLRGDPKDDAENISYLGYQLPPIDGPPAGVGSGTILLMDFVDTTILNNTLVGNAIEYIPASETYAIHEGIFGAEADKPKKVDIRNNLIIGSGSPIESETFENFIIEYNLFWNEPPEFDLQLPYFSDETNIIANPLFISPEDMDFHLMPDSPAINHGDPEIKDKDGTRSDMGVYGGPYAYANVGISLSDAHVHLFEYGPQFIDGLMAEMDKHNVRKTVLFGSADQIYTDESKYVGGIWDEIDRQVLEACDKYSDRIFPMLSGFDPQNENSVSYLENQLSTGKWKGIGEIYMVHESLPNYKTRADHPVMLQIYRVLARYDVPIFFHHERWSQEDVDTLYQAMGQNPDVKFVWLHFAHAPENLEELENALNTYLNLYIEFEYVVFEAEGFSPQQLALLENYSNRFMLGTDIGCIENLETPHHVPYGETISAHRRLLSQLSRTTAERIGYKNLEELMG